MNSNKEILVSIITPCFNSEKYIEETINSVIQQSYSNWEMIIVDDGSTDNTLNIIDKFTAKYENINIYIRDRSPKSGNTCRNIGISHSKGDYIVFLDADDLLVPTCLEKRIGYLMDNKDLDFIVFKMGRFVENRKMSNNINYFNIDPLEHFVGLDCIWQTTAPIWTKNIIQNIGGWNEDYVRLQDVELAFRALTTSNVKFLLIDEVDSYYRQETKIYDKDFWQKAQEPMMLYINDVLSWIENDKIKNSYYLQFLNRTVWNYMLYSWRSENMISIRINSFLKKLFENNAISLLEYILQTIIVRLDKKFIHKIKIIHNFVEIKIRLFKKIFSKC